MSDLVEKITSRGTPHDPDTPALNVSDVSLVYQIQRKPFVDGSSSSKAIEDITFQANLSEQIAIIGPNGAGKSTLLKVVAGILKPDSGIVELFGSAPDKHICIAYVPQRSEIDWSFPVTVADMVMMGRIKKIGLFRHPRKDDHEIVHACLARVHADHLAHQHISELSGGQQQRVFIARALALETDLLLLDEPLTGLDIPSQEALMRILDGLRPDGVTVLVATHDLSFTAERFNRVMLLNKKVIAQGAPSSVLTQANLVKAYGSQSTLG